MSSDIDKYAAFHVPFASHLFFKLRQRTQPFWRALGRLESASLREQLDGIEIRQPLYIAGLPRSGSTILLEIMAAHGDVATHRYRDVWSIYTPYWSRQFRASARMEKVERSHGDGIMVTPDSPEAIEEVIWMSFFDHLHDWQQSNVLDGDTDQPDFEQFYRDHLKKLLFVRRRSRYAAKGNYNFLRLEYLQKLFSDARFIDPIRNPRDQIASLRKQHRLLTEAANQHPRSTDYLNHVGHFEFGANRRPLNMGDDESVRSILQLWSEGQEVRGWARLWAQAYGRFMEIVSNNPRLNRTAVVIRYEDLCGQPEESLSRLLDHANLRPHGQFIQD